MSEGWVWLGGIITLVLLVPSGAPAPAPADALPLFLLAREDGAPLPNFTAHAPDAEEPVKVLPTPILTGSGEVVWKWVMNRVPERWDAAPGTEVTASLHFLRLDRIVPVADPLAHSDGLARIKITIDLLRYSSDESIAHGSTTLVYDPLSTYSTPIAVSIKAPVTDGATYDVVPGDAPLLGLKVTMIGQARNHDPPLLLVGSPETPSHVLIPTFPVPAFAAWEQHEADTESCNARTLEGLPCHEQPSAPAPLEPDLAPRATSADVPSLAARMASPDGLAATGAFVWIVVSALARHVLARWR